MKSLFIFWLLVFSLNGFAQQILATSDTEGSTRNLDEFVTNHQMKWDANGNLDFINPTDKFVFDGDMSGPNWQDPENPRNLFIRDQLMQLKQKYPERVYLIWGNHEASRMAYVRDNLLIQNGQLPDYDAWLKKKNLTDNKRNRVYFWGEKSYGNAANGVPKPVEDYRRELQLRLKRAVTPDEAALTFADDLAVGKPGKPNGKTLDFLLKFDESRLVESNGKYWAVTHAPLTPNSFGHIPGQSEIVKSSAFFEMRNDLFFKPEMKRFMELAAQGKVPSSIIPHMGDARSDGPNHLTNEIQSISYSERAKIGSRYLSIDDKIAKTLMNDPKYPVVGILSGHKPGGTVQTIYRIKTPKGEFLDICLDVSRGKTVRTTFSINGSQVSLTRLGPNGEVIVTSTGGKTNSMIGKVTADGFTIKEGPDAQGNYYMEKYSGYDVVGETRSAADLNKAELAYSSSLLEGDDILQDKIERFSNAVTEAGGQMLNDDEIARLVGGREVIELIGPSDWKALSQPEMDAIRNQLKSLAQDLDPSKVLITTGGNKANNPNAFETMVHEVFAGNDVPANRRVPILGFAPRDTPVSEVDPLVKHIYPVGENGNWDSAAMARFRFTGEHGGSTLAVGGGGVIKRMLSSPEAATRKSSLYLMQGFGGASEAMADTGTAVSSIDELKAQLAAKKPGIFISPATARAAATKIPGAGTVDAGCIDSALEAALGLR